jgi:hypothetical protein
MNWEPLAFQEARGTVSPWGTARRRASPLVPPQLAFESAEELSTIDAADLMTGDLAYVVNEATFYVLDKASITLSRLPKLCYALHACPCQLHPECGSDIELAVACMLSRYDARNGGLPSPNLVISFGSEKKKETQEMLDAWERSGERGPMTEWSSEHFPSAPGPSRWLRMSR